MEKSFEREVLDRLTIIESKLDDYKDVKQKSDEAFNTSKQNKKDIDEINEKIKWITRSVGGALITGLIGLLFALIK